MSTAELVKYGCAVVFVLQCAGIVYALQLLRLVRGTVWYMLLGAMVLSALRVVNLGMVATAADVGFQAPWMVGFFLGGLLGLPLLESAILLVAVRMTYHTVEPLVNGRGSAS